MAELATSSRELDEEELVRRAQLGSGTSPFRPGVPKGTRIRAVFPLSQAKPCYLAGVSQERRT